MALIEIDGSTGEGGGQLVRTSIALATLLTKGIHIRNVRAKRSPPGFRSQHLTGVKAVATIADADVTGLEIGSQDLVFEPHRRLAGSFTFDIGTAGSIPLVLQALMPAAAFAPKQTKVNLIGGTNVRWSPSIDYVLSVLLPTLGKMGYNGKIAVEQRGHYPKGGGRVTAIIDPVRKLKSINFTEFGKVKKIYVLSHCVKLPSHVADRQAKSAVQLLREAGYDNLELKTEWYRSDEDPHLGPGSGVTVCAETTTGALLGSDSLGERGKPAEKVGEEAAQELIRELDSRMPVDKHMGDMLIPYVSVAEGRSQFKVSEITLHLVTNIQIAEALADVKFQVEGKMGTPGTISVKGIGLMNAAVED
ncbi:MAG TPA: RNA 3'-terminal phosphate cyclase [archaeon]|nr:RNA 3'-terminal phosphate cyclase [archaeon]